MSETKAVIETRDVSVDKIKTSPYQPRIDFDLEELRGSIIKYGIIDPLKVRKVGDYWELIDGERRWRIAKQEGIKTVPCLVLEYTDEEADELSWKFNTERKNYTFEERAKHFKKHQDEGLSGAAIGRRHGYHRNHVYRLLAIFRLPEKYQNYLWSGDFAVQKYEYLHDKGLINGKTAQIGAEVIKIIDEVAIERNLTQREFENVVDTYLSDAEKRQVEEAKKVATRLKASKRREAKAREALGEPDVKPPETVDELENAAKALIEEAERRKTDEQKAEEKRQEQIAQAKKTLKATLKKIDSADKIIDVSTFRERFNELKESLEEDPVEVRTKLMNLGEEVTDAKKQREKEIKAEKEHKKLVDKARKLLSSISFEECAKLGIDAEPYKNQVAEIERYLNEKPTEAWNAADALKKKLEEELTEAKIQKEVEKRAKKLEDAEKRRLGEEAKIKAREELMKDQKFLRQATEMVLQKRDWRGKEIPAKGPEKEIVTEDMWECPICHVRHRLIHFEPKGHKLEEIR